MFINVKFIGSLHSLSGKAGLRLSVENPVSMRQVVKRIVGEAPNLRRVLVNPESETPMASVLVLVNGKEISVLNGFETVVKAGDEVVFVPVVHGG